VAGDLAKSALNGAAPDGVAWRDPANHLPAELGASTVPSLPSRRAVPGSTTHFPTMGDGGMAAAGLPRALNQAGDAL
jgi:hypothetical protein